MIMRINVKTNDNNYGNSTTIDYTVYNIWTEWNYMLIILCKGNSGNNNYFRPSESEIDWQVFVVEPRSNNQLVKRGILIMDVPTGLSLEKIPFISHLYTIRSAPSLSNVENIGKPHLWPIPNLHTTNRGPSAWMAIRSQSASAWFNASIWGFVLNLFRPTNVRFSCNKFLQVHDDDAIVMVLADCLFPIFLWDITGSHPFIPPWEVSHASNTII